MSDPVPGGRRRRRLAISVGDVAGVGPELALRAAADPTILRQCRPVLLGPLPALRRVAETLSLELPPTIDADSLETLDTTATPIGDTAAVIDCGQVDPDDLVPGQFSASTGRASFEAVKLAVQLTCDRRCDAVVTGPIQKEAWHDAGTGYLGHTELLADLTDTTEVCMMLSGPEVSSVLCTIHLPLADAIAQLNAAAVQRAIRLAGEAMQRRLNRPPRIAVLGLNPHAGENGLLSHGEERHIIEPAIEAVRNWLAETGRDWTIHGPLPPDTAFTPAIRQATDVHVCMYHDQGLIPLKALSFDDAVNVTLGLPIVRTSVDHGTALDLAWQGRASVGSMLSAIRMAVELCGE